MSTTHSVNPTINIHEFYEIGEQFIKLRTTITNPYEENFFEKILPLKTITNSQVIAIYWVDNHKNMITSSQKEINIKEPCSIPIECKGPLPGVVAFFKYGFMISDAAKYAKWYCNYIKLPDLVFCILSFPILSEKNDDVIAVVELYRTSCYPFVDLDLQYVKQLSKWIAITMEQNYDMQIQKNIFDINNINMEILFNFFGGHTNYLTYMTTLMAYVKNSVNADQLFFYFVTSNDELGYADNFEMYSEEYNKKTKKISLIKINAKIKFFNENTFEYKIIRSKKPISEEISIENDQRIDTQMRRYIRKTIKSIVYIPVLLNNNILGIIVLVNKNARVSVNKFTDLEIQLLMTIVSYLSLALHYLKTKNELDLVENKYYVIKDTLVSLLLKKVDASDDIATNPVVSANFYEFEWAAQDNDNIISLTYFIFTHTCPGLFVEETLKLFLTAVKRMYRDKPYHNFRLGFIYLHTMFCILDKIDDIFDLTEKCALLLTSLVRFIDYNGLHNKIMEEMGHPLIRIYDNFYHQHHAIAVVEFLVNRTKVFNHLPSIDIDKILKYNKYDRLSVVSKYTNNEKLSHLLDMKILDFNDLQHREYIRVLLLWCTFNTRHSLQLELSRKINEDLYREWFSQGDKLVKLNKRLPHIRFDRTAIDRLKEFELKHINSVFLPHFELVCRIYPKLCEWKNLLLFTKKAIELQIELKHKQTWSIEQSLGRLLEDIL